MKYIKLFALLAVTTFLCSCSDDDESWNTASDVTVGMQSENITVKENKGIFNVPIEIKGNKNGNVKVTIAVSEIGENPAKEDVHYYVTDKTLILSGTTGSIEIETVDDDEINTNRTFKVSITDAQGAEIDNESTIITLKDNDSQFYDKLTGEWTMTAVDPSDGSPLSWTVNVSGADEDEPDYEKYLYVSGMMGYAWTQAVLSYHYDQNTQEGYVAMEMGSYNFAEDVNFGLGGYNNVILYSRVNDSFSDTPVKGVWSEDFKTITFEPTAIYGLIFDDSSTEWTKFYWFGAKNIVMTKGK